MKKILLVLLTFLFGFTLVGCAGNDEVETAVEQFCNDNPDALICDNPDAARDQIVADMFNTIMVEFVAGSNDDFCTDYFDDSALIDTCKNDRFDMVPSDFGDLGDDIVINPLSATNEYEVLTEYGDGSDAYRFEVKITESDGLIKFNRFVYEERDTTNDVTLTETELKMFMTGVINASDDNNATYCDTYFTGNANTACNQEISDVIPSIYHMYQQEITSLGDGSYQYKAYTYDGLDAYVYTIKFVSDGASGYLISEINSYNDPNYNTLTHAYTKMTDELVYQFNRVNGGSYEACSYVVDDGTTTCRDSLNAFSGETMSIGDYTESDTAGLFEFTLTFDSGALTVYVEIIVDEYHTYWLDITWGEPTVETTASQITALFEQYIVDFFDSTVRIEDQEYMMDNFPLSGIQDGVSRYDNLTLTNVTIVEENAEYVMVELTVDIDFDDSYYQDDFTRTYVDKVEIVDGEYLIPPITYYPTYRELTDAQAQTLIQDLFDEYYNGTINYEQYVMNEGSFQYDDYVELMTYPENFFPAVQPSVIELTRLSGFNGYYVAYFTYIDEFNESYVIAPLMDIEIGYEDGEHKLMYMYVYDEWGDAEVSSILSDWFATFIDTSVSNTDACSIFSGYGFDCETLRDEALSTSVSYSFHKETITTGLDQVYLDMDINGTAYVFKLNTRLMTSSPWGYYVDSLEYQNPDIAFTYEQIDTMVHAMYEDYYQDSTIDCSDYFTTASATICNINQSAIFHTMEVNDPRLYNRDYSDEFIVYPHNYNGYFDGYTMLYPVYVFDVVVNNGQVLFDNLVLFNNPTEAEYDALVAELHNDVMDNTVTDEVFCEWYNFYEANPFSSRYTCSAFRQELITNDATTTYGFVFGPNPYGDEIPIVRITMNDEVFDFEASPSYYDINMFQLYGFWYVLYPEPVTEEQANTAVDVFEQDLLDTGMSNTDFCTVYPLGDDCETWRDDVLSGTDVTVTVNVDTTESIPSYDLVVTVDGENTTFDIDVDTSGDTPLINTITPQTACICDSCDPCVCDQATLVHAISNRGLWQEFMDDFNDEATDNASLLSAYFADINNDLIQLRDTILGQLLLEFAKVDIIYNGDQFDYATALLQVVDNGTITQYQVDYVATVIDEETVVITILDFSTSTGLSESDAETAFHAYMTDYLDYNVSNDSLINEYLNGDIGTLLDDRMSFLFNAGTIVIQSVVYEDGVFKAIYAETLDGTTTTYVQVFELHDDQTMTFLTLQTMDIIVSDTTESEAQQIIIDYFSDVADDTMSTEELCNTYYDGIETCPLVDARDPQGTTYRLTGFSAEEQDDQMVYTLHYEKEVFGVTYEVVDTLTVQRKSDNTYIISPLTSTMTLQTTDNFGSVAGDIEAEIAYIQTFYEDYYNNTISNEVFCDTHIYMDTFSDDLYTNYGGLAGFCAMYRQYQYDQNGDLDLIHVNYVGSQYTTTGVRANEYEVILYGTFYGIWGDDDGYDYYYYNAIGVVPDATATHGYLMMNVQPAVYAYTALTPTQIDAFVANEVAFITNPQNDSETICNRYDIYTPGHQCFVDIASVAAYDFIGYNYSLLNEPISTSNGEIGMNIQLIYRNSVTQLDTIISIPLKVDTNYTTYPNMEIVLDTVTYINSWSSQFTYDEILGLLNTFVNHYFDDTISNSDFVALYQDGNNMGGEFDYFRNQDLSRKVDPTILDVRFDLYGNYSINSSYNPEDPNQIYIVFIKNNGIVADQVIYYLGYDAVNGHQFISGGYLINHNYN